LLIRRIVANDNHQDAAVGQEHRALDADNLQPAGFLDLTHGLQPRNHRVGHPAEAFDQLHNVAVGISGENLQRITGIDAADCSKEIFLNLDAHILDKREPLRYFEGNRNDRRQRRGWFSGCGFDEDFDIVDRTWLQCAQSRIRRNGKCLRGCVSRHEKEKQEKGR